MKKYIVVVLMLFSQIALFGDTPCDLYFEENASGDNYVEIDVKIEDFVDVYGFQMYIKWDSTVIRFNSITYTHPDLNGITYNPNLDAGVLSAGWSNVLNLTTFVDGTTLFTIRYDYEGDPCDETSLELIDYGQFQKSLITYEANGTFEDPIRFTEGVVQIPGDDCGNASDGFCLHLENKTASAGSQVCVPITVQGFENIGALQFAVTWDSTVVSWVNEQNNWADSQSGAEVLTTVDESIPAYKYIMSSVESLNLEDGGVLVELCFEVKGDAQNGDVSPLTFAEYANIPFDVTDIEDNSIEFCSTDGSITVGDVDKTVTFIASNETVDRNEDVCVSFTARNFTDIESFQFMVNWDADVMTWDKLGPVNKIGLNSSHYSTEGDDNLRISWNKGFGISIADDDTLFQLCYNIVGDCNQSTEVKIIDPPSPLTIEVVSNSIAIPHQEVFGSVEIKCNIVVNNVLVENATCNGDCDGRITVQMDTPGNYNFDWSHSATEHNNSAGALCSGDYTVTITDKQDASISMEISRTVTQPEALSVTLNKVTPVTCDADGAIELNVTGGTSPYTYIWSNGATTKDISGLDAGDYIVTVDDANNCGSVETRFTVATDIPEMNLEGTMTDITCKDSNDGSITLNPTGGCPEYTVSWSDGGSGLSRTGLVAGDYKATVTDSKGTTKTKEYTITNPDSELVIDGVVKNGVPGTITLTITPAGGTYTYSWTGPGGFTSTDKNLTDLTTEGQYTVEVTNSRGCVESKTFDFRDIVDPISVNVVVNTKINNGTGVLCNGDCNGSISATVVANVPWVAYLDDVEISLPYNSVCGGEHTLKIIDNLGKEVTTTFVMPEPDAIEITVDETNCSNSGEDDGSISLTVDGGTGDYTYTWNGGTISGDSPLLENLAKGIYSVVVVDENGCEVVSEDIVIDDCDKSDCYLGSLILTPNGDGFNDFFLVKCYNDFESNELQVYNRIGNKVYSQLNYDGTWTGVDLNGNDLIEDSYMWVFIGVRANGDKEVYKGTVTILR